MKHGDSNDKQALVLIVDDNPINLKLLDGILAPAGYATLMASSSSEAFDLLYKTKPDLILLDVMMPDADGYEVARRVKLSFELKDVPIIFLTAKTGTDDIVAGFEAGGIDYVTKPFNSRELLARIQTHVALKRAREEIQTLRGILPVCANCKKVREDGGEWVSLEEFILKHTEAELSHGMCPACVTELYPSIAQKILAKKREAQ
jgi:DNA-binding response OmpR family regulator